LDTLKHSNKSQVIQGYLNGKSREQNARENNVSTGTVSNIIESWTRETGMPDLKEVRQFAVLVKKSGVSIKQCAQGFRMVQLMSRFGIHVEDDAHDEFGSFVNGVYQSCKDLAIPPSIVPSWIKDLVACHSSQPNYFSLEKSDGEGLPNHLKITASPQKGTKIDSDLGSDTNDEVKSDTQMVNDPSNPKPEQGSSIQIEEKALFVSQVSGYIDQKKKECSNLENYKEKLTDDIKGLVLQKNKVIDNINKANEREKVVMSYLDWFHRLKKELYERHSIKMEDDIENFAQAINDFKNHSYDAIEIIKEYSRLLSARLEIKTTQADLESLQRQRAVLNNTFLHWDSQVKSHRQTMGIYSELEAMKFGLKELKQLWLTVREIAVENKIALDEAVSKFLNDIEEQYDDNLGFENKINEKKDELALLNKEITSNRQTLLINPFVGSSLYRLFQNGVSEQDIIGISRLVEECTNNSTVSARGNPDADGNKENDRNKDKASNRLEQLKSLTDDLKKLGGIKAALGEQAKNLERLNHEIQSLNRQKQELIDYCNNAISIINDANNKISYLNGFTDHLKNDLGGKKKVIPWVSPLFIILINKDSKEGGAGEGEGEGD
jgi:hypothetical protein